VVPNLGEITPLRGKLGFYICYIFLNVILVIYLSSSTRPNLVVQVLYIVSIATILRLAKSNV